MRKSVFFTGVTGLIGQFIAAELLRAGYELIFFTRSKDGFTARERVAKALRFVDPYLAGNYSVVDGDLGTVADMQVSADVIFHAAGETSFSEDKRSVIMKTNYHGTKNILQFARKNDISELHYIGTAYAHDFFSSNMVKEDTWWDENKEFVNPYAESKCKAENMVRKWGQEKMKNRSFVYSPSIVSGRSSDGLITSFTGYYRFMQSFARLRDVTSKIGYNSSLDIPISVPGVLGATINIVTLDYAINLIKRLFDAGVPGCYHITNPNPPEFDYLLQEGLKVIGITGPSVRRNPSDTKKVWKLAERLVKRGIADYKPFVSYNTIFSQKNVGDVLGKSSVSHPEVSSTLIKTLMGFALAHNFDKARVYEMRELELQSKERSDLLKKIQQEA